MEWWKTEEFTVYCRGVLGTCPAKDATELTPIDMHPLPRQAVLAWAFVYESRIDEGRFREALATVLVDYPVLAGRFSSGNVVSHNNTGVRVVVGKGTRRSSALSGTLVLETEEASSKPSYVNPMDLKRVYKGKDPVLSFRLTHLLDGGTVLGVTVPHALVDGRSLAQVLAALSLQYQGEPYAKPFTDRRVLTYQPLADLCTRDEIDSFHAPLGGGGDAADDGLPSSLLRDAKLSTAASLAAATSKLQSGRRVHPQGPLGGQGGSPSGGHESAPPSSPPPSSSSTTTLGTWGSVRYLFKLLWEVVKGGKLATVVVKICPEQMGEIKERQAAQARAEGRAERISKNDIAVAYAWILMRKLQQRLGHLRGTDRENRSRMLFAADLRARNRVENLNERYFGNAAVAVEISAEPEMSLAECALAVRGAVSGLDGGGKSKGIMDLVWGVSQETSIAKTLPALVTSLPCYHDCFVTSWQFPFQDLDFGLAKPPASVFPGMFPRCPWTAIVLGDAEGAAYVHLCLPSRARDVLRTDPSVHAGTLDRASVIKP